MPDASLPPSAGQPCLGQICPFLSASTREKFKTCTVVSTVPGAWKRSARKLKRRALSAMNGCAQHADRTDIFSHVEADRNGQRE